MIFAGLNKQRSARLLWPLWFDIGRAAADAVGVGESDTHGFNAGHDELFARNGAACQNNA